MDQIKTLTVYLGSSGHARPIFSKSAEALGKLIAKEGKELIYGGMDAGLMGTLALACLKASGHVTGIIPRKIKDSERVLKDLSFTILVNHLWERKKLMFDQADAILSLPGGFGTLDESLEVLYWGSLGLHHKPLVLINIDGYWDDIIAFIKTCPDYDEQFLIVVDDLDGVFPALKKWSPPQDPIQQGEYKHFEDDIHAATTPLIFSESTIEQTYFLITALGLKQLGKHKRPIGIFNKDDCFSSLLRWFKRAAKESFITSKCLKLYDSDSDLNALNRKLETQDFLAIDLHKEKWGERRKDGR